MKLIPPIAGSVFGCLATILLCSCFSYSGQRRISDKYWNVVEGREADDFRRFSTWLSMHGGNLPLEKCGTIHWFETQWFRCYSNDQFVVAFCPPRFTEDFAQFAWLSGTICNAADIIPVLFPKSVQDENYKWAYEYSDSLHLDAAPIPDAGIYSIRFGDTRDTLIEKLGKLLPYEKPDIGVIDKRTGQFKPYPPHDKIRDNLLYQVNSFWFKSLSALDDRHSDVHCFLDEKDRVFLMHVSLRNDADVSPELYPFSYHPLPVRRSGSFSADWETPPEREWPAGPPPTK